MYSFFPFFLIVELFNRSRKFKVGNSFTRVELSLLIRLWEFSRALHIAEGISRAWDKSSFGTRVKRRREGWRWNRRGQDLIEGRCVLSGRARFIRYFSRDLSIHSLILSPVARRRGTFHQSFFNWLRTIFSRATLCARRGFFARAFAINRNRGGVEAKGAARKREAGSSYCWRINVHRNVCDSSAISRETFLSSL